MEEIRPENIKLAEVYFDQVIDGTLGLDLDTGARSTYVSSYAQLEDYYYDDYEIKTRDADYRSFDVPEDIAVLHDFYMNKHNEIKGEGRFYVFNISFDLTNNKTVNRSICAHESQIPSILDYFKIYSR